MTMSDSVQRSFFTSTIFVGRFAGSFENSQNKVFNISMLSFNFYPLGTPLKKSGSYVKNRSCLFFSNANLLLTSRVIGV